MREPVPLQATGLAPGAFWERGLRWVLFGCGACAGCFLVPGSRLVLLVPVPDKPPGASAPQQAARRKRSSTSRQAQAGGPYAVLASSRACCSFAFDCTPMNWFTSWPPLKIMIVGMLATL
jgi:hypothetical protein